MEVPSINVIQLEVFQKKKKKKISNRKSATYVWSVGKVDTRNDDTVNQQTHVVFFFIQILQYTIFFAHAHKNDAYRR